MTRRLATLCKFYLLSQSKRVNLPDVRLARHVSRIVFEKRKTIYLSSPSILLSVTAMAYKIKYDEEADILTIILKDRGKLSHAEEVGDIIVHFDKNEKPLFMEILKASKIVPLMVEGLAKKEITVT